MHVHPTRARMRSPARAWQRYLVAVVAGLVALILSTGLALAVGQLSPPVRVAPAPERWGSSVARELRTPPTMNGTGAGGAGVYARGHG